MSGSPVVVYLRHSQLAKSVRDLNNGVLNVGEWNSPAADDQPAVAQVLPLALDQAAQLWDQVEGDALGRPLLPLLVGRGNQLPDEASIFLRSAPRVASLESGQGDRVIQAMLENVGRASKELREMDARAEPLVENALCVWVRCSVGIVGVIELAQEIAMPPEAQLAQLNAVALATIDRLPSRRLLTEDLWSLLLVVNVPWMRRELEDKNNVEITSKLKDFTRNIQGSRKLVRAKDESLRQLLGPIDGLAGAVSQLHISANDPLRDEIKALARSSAEREALEEILFKRKFAPEDVDRLLMVLGAQHD